jgi:hypothetical protein
LGLDSEQGTKSPVPPLRADRWGSISTTTSAGFEIDVATVTGYPIPKGESMPTNPKSLYYAW